MSRKKKPFGLMLTMHKKNLAQQIKRKKERNEREKT